MAPSIRPRAGCARRPAPTGPGGAPPVVSGVAGTPPGALVYSAPWPSCRAGQWTTRRPFAARPSGTGASRRGARAPHRPGLSRRGSTAARTPDRERLLAYRDPLPRARCGRSPACAPASRERFRVTTTRPTLRGRAPDRGRARAPRRRVCLGGRMPTAVRHPAGDQRRRRQRVRPLDGLAPCSRRCARSGSPWTRPRLGTPRRMRARWSCASVCFASTCSCRASTSPGRPSARGASPGRRDGGLVPVGRGALRLQAALFSGKDVVDLERLIAVSGNGIDAAYVRRWLVAMMAPTIPASGRGTGSGERTRPLTDPRQGSRRRRIGMRLSRGRPDRPPRRPRGGGTRPSDGRVLRAAGWRRGRRRWAWSWSPTGQRRAHGRWRDRRRPLLMVVRVLLRRWGAGTRTTRVGWRRPARTGIRLGAVPGRAGEVVHRDRGSATHVPSRSPAFRRRADVRENSPHAAGRRSSPGRRRRRSADRRGRPFRTPAHELGRAHPSRRASARLASVASVR